MNITQDIYYRLPKKSINHACLLEPEWSRVKIWPAPQPCLYASQRISLPRRHKFAKPTDPLQKISCLLSKIFYSLESYTSLVNLCLLGRLMVIFLSWISATYFQNLLWFQNQEQLIGSFSQICHNLVKLPSIGCLSGLTYF